MRKSLNKKLPEKNDRKPKSEEIWGKTNGKKWIRRYPERHVWKLTGDVRESNESKSLNLAQWQRLYKFVWESTANWNEKDEGSIQIWQFSFKVPDDFEGDGLKLQYHNSSWWNVAGCGWTKRHQKIISFAHPFDLQRRILPVRFNSLKPLQFHYIHILYCYYI